MTCFSDVCRRRKLVRHAGRPRYLSTAWWRRRSISTVQMDLRWLNDGGANESLQVRTSVICRSSARQYKLLSQQTTACCEVTGLSHFAVTHLLASQPSVLLITLLSTISSLFCGVFSCRDSSPGTPTFGGGAQGGSIFKDGSLLKDSSLYKDGSLFRDSSLFKDGSITSCLQAAFLAQQEEEEQQAFQVPRCILLCKKHLSTHLEVVPYERQS